MPRVTPFHVCSSKAARLGSELQPAKICHSHGPTSSRESAMAQLSMLVADMHTLRHMTTGSFTALLMADLGPGQPGTRCWRTCPTRRSRGAPTGSPRRRRPTRRRGPLSTTSPKVDLVDQSRSQSGRCHTSPGTTPTGSRACHTNPTHSVDSSPPSSSGAVTEPQGWQRESRQSRRHTHGNHKSSPSPHVSHSRS